MSNSCQYPRLAPKEEDIEASGEGREEHTLYEEVEAAPNDEGPNKDEVGVAADDAWLNYRNEIVLNKSNLKILGEKK